MANEKTRMGQGSFANMPQDVKMTPYEKNMYVTPDQLDDTITGIDETIGNEVKRTRGHLSKQK